MGYRVMSVNEDDGVTKYYCNKCGDVNRIIDKEGSHIAICKCGEMTGEIK